MKYICYKNFVGTAVTGKQVNIPYATKCDGVLLVPPKNEDFNISKIQIGITHNNYPICIRRSQNGIEHFARNDDNYGLIRGHIVSSIKRHLIPQGFTASDFPYYSRLTEHDIEELNVGHADQRVERWAAIWRSELAHKYKRNDQGEYWVWDTNFYDASIHDLVYIADVCKLKVPEQYRQIAKDEKQKIYF